MFEVGFTEMVVIAVLALIVLGPEKLPKVAAQVGRWLGRARNMARQFREQLEEEAILEESRPKRKAAGAASSGSAAGGAAATAAPTSVQATATAAMPGAQPAASSDDPDTRHNDYAGAAWEAPAAESGSDPAPASAVTSAAATEDAQHVGRGA